MAKIIIDSDGDKHYYNDNDFAHREDGPALIRTDGVTVWYYDGLVHRVGGPAHVTSCGVISWSQRGETDRVGGPAREFPNGLKKWYEYEKGYKPLWPELE